MHAPAAPSGRPIQRPSRLAVALRHRVPAAVLVAEVLGQIGQVDELVGILVGIVEPADDDVGAAADIGRHRRLGPHVFPGLVVDLHLDAGLSVNFAVFAIHRRSSPSTKRRQRSTRSLAFGLGLEAEGVLGPGAVGQDELRSEGAGRRQPCGAGEGRVCDGHGSFLLG
jgi:hypothetical protein